MQRFLAERFLKSFGSLSSPWVRRLSLGGLSLSIALLLVTQGVFAGFEGIFKQSLQSFNAHLVALHYGELSQERLLKLLPNSFKKELISLNYFSYTESLLVHKGRVQGLSLKGLPKSTLSQINYLKFYFNNNQQPVEIKDLIGSKKSKEPGLILGRDLMESFHLKPGDLVRLFRVEEESALDAPENFHQFEVLGAFEAGLKDFDGSFGLVAREDLQALWTEASLGQGWEMRLKDPQKALYWQKKLQTQLSQDWRWISWQKLNEPILQGLRLDRLVFFLIMALVVVVALASLAGFLALMVLERSSDLYLLRCLGLSRKKIFALLEKMALLFSLRALLMGLILGLGTLVILRYGAFALSKEVYRVSTLPVEISWSLVGLLVAFSLLASWISLRLFLKKILKIQPNFY